MNNIYSVALSIIVALLFAGNNILAQNNSALTTTNKQVTNITGTSTSVNSPVYWENIHEKDITWKKRVWRDIDGHENQNTAFVYSEGNPRNNMLINIFIDGVNNGTIKAYSAIDDRFTTLLNKEEFLKLVTPGSSGFNPEKIYKFRIKEDWLFNKNTGIMTIRILGIAPVIDITAPDGSITTQALFWIYYPDCRGLLAQHEVNSLGKDSKPITWDECFESRQFKSKIDTGKLSADPPEKQWAH